MLRGGQTVFFPPSPLLAVAGFFPMVFRRKTKGSIFFFRFSLGSIFFFWSSSFFSISTARFRFPRRADFSTFHAKKCGGFSHPFFFRQNRQCHFFSSHIFKKNLWYNTKAFWYFQPKKSLTKRAVDGGNGGGFWVFLWLEIFLPLKHSPRPPPATNANRWAGTP